MIIALTVVLLHLLSANLLVPKFIGSRVNREYRTSRR